MYAKNVAGIASSRKIIRNQPRPGRHKSCEVRAGTHIGTLCEAIHRQQVEVGVRRTLGVLSLAKKYGFAAVDEACAAALSPVAVPIRIR